MNNLQIKQVTLREVVQLQKISRETFYETFAALNSEENMQKYLQEELSLEKLTAEISNPGSVFFFALFKNELVGYLKLNFGKSQTELKDERALEIERIYVSKKLQGKEVGQMLFDKAIEVAMEKDVEYVWLGVWEENLKAICFYKRNGFAAFDKHIFRLGDDEQTDIMMKRELK